MSRIFQEQEYKLTPKAKLSNQIEYIIFAIVALIVVGGASWLFSFNYKIIIFLVVVVLVVAGFLIFVLAKLEYEKYSYSLDEEGVTVVSGVLFKSKKFIPYNTVQDVIIEKGPILRKLKLTHIVIRGINTTVILGDIEENTSKDVKKYILEERSKYNIEY